MKVQRRADVECVSSTLHERRPDIPPLWRDDRGPPWRSWASSRGTGSVSYTHLDVYKRQPLYRSLKEILFESKVIGTDDTGVKVLDEDVYKRQA